MTGVPNLHEHLSVYMRENLNVIPVPYGTKGDKGMMPWRDYIQRRATNDEVASWFNGHHSNIGIVCGTTSENLLDVDIESEDVFKRLFPNQERLLAQTYVYKSGNGIHVLFKLPAPFTGVRKVFDGENLLLELRGQGCMVLAPPSLHPNGKTYQRISSTDQIAKITDPGFVPDLLALIEEQLGVEVAQDSEVVNIKEIQKGIVRGGRNESALKLATYYRIKNQNREDTLTLLKAWNRKNTPPLLDAELNIIVASAFKHEKPYAFRFQTEQTAPQVTLISARDLAAKTFPEREWIARPLIPRGSVAFFAGKRSSNKTFAALDLALAVAGGRPFLQHFDTIRVPVLYIEAENGEQTISERLTIMTGDAGVPGDIEFAFFPMLKFDTKEGSDFLDGYLTKHPGALIFVDTFRRVVGMEENDAKEVNDALYILKSFAEKHGATFILLHHLRKGLQGHHGDVDLAEEMRGSSEMANIADSILIFERTRRDSKTLIMRHMKSRVGVEHDTCRVEIESDDDSFVLRYTGTWEDLDAQPELAAKAVLKWVVDTGLKEFKTKEVKEALREQGFSSRAVYRGLQSLLDQHKLVRPAKGRYAVPAGTLADYDVPTCQTSQNDSVGEAHEV